MLSGFTCFNQVERIITEIGFYAQLFAYDTVKTFLTPKNGAPSHLPVPPSTIAGATAGVCSTLTMYPLELLKTRLTVEVIYFTPKPSSNLSQRSFQLFARRL